MVNELRRCGWRFVSYPVIANRSLGTSGWLVYVFEQPIQTPRR